MNDPIPTDEVPRAAPPPEAPAPEVPRPEAPQSEPESHLSRHFLPRAFGLSHEDLFIEGTLYRAEANPQVLNSEGRFAKEDSDTGAAGDKDPWVEYASLEDLRVKTGWVQDTFQSFLAHLQSIINRQ